MPRFGLISFALFIVLCPEAYSQDYFPLGREGSRWTYGGFPREDARLVTMGEVESTEDPTLYQWDGFSGSRIIWRQETSVIERRGGGDRLFLDLVAGVGSSWSLAQIDSAGDVLDDTRLQVVDREERVVVPAGTFERCIHLGATPSPSLADAGLLAVWLAPNVGLVRWVEQTIVGPQTYELAVYHIEGRGADATFSNRTQVVRNGVNYEVATDRSGYNLSDTLRIAYDVTAVDVDSLYFSFTSTQQIEFVLLDERDLYVWVWSADKGFGDAITGFPLTRGDSKSFRESVSLLSLNLTAGAYNLIGYLPSTLQEGGMVASGETKVSVPLLVEESRSSPVEVDLNLDARVYKPDGQIDVSYTLTNASESEWTMFFPSGQRYDLVLDGHGGRLWTWSSLRLFIQATGEIALAPGESFEFREIITLEETGVTGPGQYVLSAYMTTSGGPVNLEDTIVRRKFVVDEPTDPASGSWSGSLNPRLRVDLNGDELVLRYVLLNDGFESARLSFDTGQTFEIILAESETEIWRWSNGRDFHQALWERELSPGDSIVVGETVQLADLARKEGELLTVIASLKVSPNQGEDPSSNNTKIVVDVRILDGFLVSVVTREGSGPGVYGDFNGDGSVSFADFVLFGQAYGSREGTPGYDSLFDLDSDGQIAFTDFVRFATVYGT